MNESKECGSCSSKSTCGTQSQPSQADVQDQLIHGTLSIIKNKLLVMSGKGGVGKSSVSANLAVALSRRGVKVGLMDVDLHGPDIPRMLGLEGLLEISADNRLIPKEYSDNLKVVSIESLAENRDQAVIWRGPLKFNVIRQFLSDCHWERLDYLIIDSPPGTGDEPLTIAQTIPDAKAVIVTTPQEISLADVRKSINFCNTVHMPVLGVIENMSGFVCPHCGKATDLFGTGGGERTAAAMNLPFLGRIPFDPRMVACADAGQSCLEKFPEAQVTKAYEAIVEKILAAQETASPARASAKA
ncbi:MAG: Mrp/NBP35 family ATP-binding protein [Deltaproteobacteria bacterium]|nr:Mrp/NBP35 family ATP-binding protein [Deltaproteobacteria bacterium]